MNQASLGGAMNIKINSSFSFSNNCTVVFNSNEATNGGAIHLTDNSVISFSDASSTTFIKNHGAVG